MKLEVGMYVRTKRGQIGKIVTIGRDNIAIEFNRMWCDIVHKENVVKEPSFNVLDLIEEGDFVNEEMITKIKEDEDGKYLVTMNNNVIRNQRIESILTHEQMEQIAYKVGE